jgi:uncharacterized membrane protein YphA (DoxX/SURF4 family)
MKASASLQLGDMDAWRIAGLLATPVRWVLGWMFFSAFWRRVVLAPAKIDPSSAAYVGGKFNHFLPHALWIQPLLKYLVLHASALYVFLIVFTIIEGLVGLSLIFGLGTRLGALGITLLSWGILLGAGWLGTTCLDEWQIGAMGIAAGLTVLLTGAGSWSLDAWWQRRWPQFANVGTLRWLSSGPILKGSNARKITTAAAILAIFSLGITLYTNQAFSGGVWGTLHNPSKQPHITLSQPNLASDGTLDLTLYRDGGPDTYGAFIVEIIVKDSTGKAIETFDASQLASLSASAIENHYLVKVTPGANSLVVPLGAQASIHIQPASPAQLPSGKYQIVVEDVSGMSWSTGAILQ